MKQKFFLIFCVKFKIGGFLRAHLRSVSGVRRKLSASDGESHTHTHKIIQPPRTWTIHTQRTVSQLRGLSSGGCQPSLFLIALTKILRRPLYFCWSPLWEILRALVKVSFGRVRVYIHTYPRYNPKEGRKQYAFPGSHNQNYNYINHSRTPFYNNLQQH